MISKNSLLIFKRFPKNRKIAVEDNNLNNSASKVLDNKNKIHLNSIKCKMKMRSTLFLTFMLIQRKNKNSIEKNKSLISNMK
jgi:hypothetical protein